MKTPSLLPIDSPSLIEEFHNSLKGHPRFGHYSYLQVAEAIRGAFAFLKRSMKDPDLPSVRLRNFGLFQVRVGKAIGVMKAHQRGLSSPNVEQRELIEARIQMLRNFIGKHEPEKLILVDEQSKAYAEKHQSLDNREPEVSAVLQPTSLDPEVSPKAHPGTDWFAHFFHEG